MEVPQAIQTVPTPMPTAAALPASASNASSPFNVFALPARNETREFIESNSIVAKLAFFILVAIVFVILLRLGTSFLMWVLGPNSNPHIIDGMVDGRQRQTFSKPLARSDDQKDGIEFTWSTWVYVDDLTYKQGSYKHIFSKGTSDVQLNGLAFPLNSPGLYLAPDTNELVVLMNSFDVINNEIRIPNIPINKWIHVVIRLQGSTMDVYMNGIIVSSEQLRGVPKQNNNDVHQGLNGGFSGNVSNLWYYNHALNIREIQALTTQGPNLRMVGGNNMTVRNNDYLSLRWYLSAN